MVRLQIPQVLTAKESISIRPKTDDDVNMGQMMEEQVRINRKNDIVKRGGSASIEWAPVIKVFENTKREGLSQKITETILQTGSRISATVLDKYINAGSREDFIKTVIVNLMSTPEYQLS